LENVKPLRFRANGRGSHHTILSSGEGFAAWATTADETIEYYKSNKNVGITAAQVQENSESGLNMFPCSAREVDLRGDH
jgi:hypothetical protein